MVTTFILTPIISYTSIAATSVPTSIPTMVTANIVAATPVKADIVKMVCSSAHCYAGVSETEALNYLDRQLDHWC